MNQKPFDIERARLLVDEISGNLAALPADSAKYAQLRAEVDALKSMLESPDAQPAAVQDSMKSVHGLFDRAAEELRADGIRAGTVPERNRQDARAGLSPAMLEMDLERRLSSRKANLDVVAGDGPAKEFSRLLRRP
jgi:hypothetical protein